MNWLGNLDQAAIKAVRNGRRPAGVTMARTVSALAEPEGFSLPSKHTTLAALTAGACARSLGADGAARYAVSLLAAAGAGASRVYLGVHWPSDVLAAWLFAEGWLHLSDSVRGIRWPRPGRHPTAASRGR